MRCSGSLRSASTWSRAASGMQEATSTPSAETAFGRATACGRREALEGGTPLLSARRHTTGRGAAASAELRATSPASAIASIATASVATGPATSSSRWTLPAVKNSTVPDVIPIDIRRVVVPPGDPDSSDTVHRPLHLPCCPSSPLGMTRAVEQEQERVAAPLQQPRTPCRTPRRAGSRRRRRACRVEARHRSCRDGRGSP